MKIVHEFEYHPSPEDLAVEFTNMEADKHVAFLNRLALEDWWPMQLQFITEHEDLSVKARALMKMIGEYAYEEKPTP